MSEQQFNIHSAKAFLRQYARDLWAHRWLAVSVAWAVALLAIPAVMLVPNRYEASTRIYVDTQTVLKPLLADLTYQPDFEQQVKMLARVVVSRPNLEQLIATPAIGLAGLSDEARESYVNRLMQQIKVDPVGIGNLYTISYRDPDRERAQRIVEATLDLFVKSSFASKKRDSAEAGQFIEEEIKTYESKLVEAENRLKEFKLKNFGVSGASNQDFFARISVLSEELNKLMVELGAAEQAREAYRRELAGESPQLPADPAAAITTQPSELDSRLEAQKKQLDELLRRYTDAHPDVIASRRVIAQLEAQKRREAEERDAARKSGQPALNAATSPVYQKIRVALAETEAQVASLRSQVGAKKAALDQLRAVAGRVPQVEAEFAQLNRDYDVIRKNYEALVARRESAAIGKRLDETSRMAEFRIVEPPRVAQAPVFPARLHIGAALIFVALLAGVLAPLVRDTVWPTFKDAKALRAAIARPFLGSVSMSFPAGFPRIGRAEVYSLALVLAGLALLQGGWIVWLASRGATH